MIFLLSETRHLLYIDRVACYRCRAAVDALNGKKTKMVTMSQPVQLEEKRNLLLSFTTNYDFNKKTRNRRSDSCHDSAFRFERDRLNLLRKS